MGRIPPEIVDQIKETARVEEVIGEFVELKRAGSNLKGFSPFNSERTPSFFVSPAKQIWKDFSSGKGGDVVKFLMEHEGMSYPEALRWLAKKYHIEIPETQEDDEEAQARQRAREQLFAALEFAKDWYMDQLYNTDEGRAVGLSYFRERGFLEKTLRAFDIGYAPESYDAFYKAAREKGFTDEVLEKAGLIIRKHNRIIDRFYNRVIFPIHRLSGNVVAFAGRVLGDAKQKAKYINSPETEVYQKSKILYGLHKAKKAILNEKDAYLVEGYTDVLAFYQAGIENTVASAGTALTAEQVKLLKRFTETITLVYDGDPAGLRAAIRGVDIILENDMNVNVVVLPEGEDPDSFARRVSTEELIAYLENNKQDFIRFAARIMLDGSDNPMQVYEMIKHVIESIARIPNAIKRELYIREVAKISGIDERKLFYELGRALQRKIAGRRDYWQSAVSKPSMQIVEERKPSVNRMALLEKEIIKLLLLYGSEKTRFPYYFVKDEVNGEPLIEKKYSEDYVWRKIYLELQSDEIVFSTSVFKRIYEILMDKYLQGEEPRWEEIRTQFSEEELEALSDLFFEEEKHRLSDWRKKRIKNIDLKDNLPHHVVDVLYNLRYEWINQWIDRKIEEVKEQNRTSLDPVLEEIQHHLRLRHIFGRILHRAV